MIDVVILIAATCIASAIGAVTGFGVSTMLIPVLALFLPAAEAVLLAAVLHLANDCWRLGLFHRNIQWSLVVSFGIAAAAMSVLGAVIGMRLPADLLRDVIGSLVLVYGMTLEMPITLRATSRPVLVVGGAISGLLAGVSGIAGPVRSAFLSSYRPSSISYFSTLAVIGLMTDIPRIAAYIAGGVSITIDSWTLLGMVVATAVGVIGVGSWAKRITSRTLQRLVGAGLIIIGGYFLFLAR